MWGLDRFSAHTTPAASPPGRNSPAPRRSLQTQRPGLTPRTSSLTVLSNHSQSNLPSTARTSISSGLKNQIYSAPPEDVEDPLAVFERLISSTLSNIKVPDETTGSSAQDAPKPRSEDFATDIDFGGRSLQECLEEEDSAITKGETTASYSSVSVEECMSWSLCVVYISLAYVSS